MSKKRDVYKTYDAFPGDELSLAECQALRKKAKFRDPALLSQEEIDDMKQGIVDSIRRPMNLNAVQTMIQSSDSKGKIKFSDSVNETLLFTQLEQAIDKKSFITHNFDQRSEELYIWPIFNDITEAVMGPIYYLIQKYKKGVPPVITTISNDAQKRRNLQHQIANSGIICISLINGIEDTMGCMLTRMIVNEKRLVFIFEWYEEPLFLFFIVFDAPECGVTTPNHSMILHRSDLFVAHQVEDDDDDNNIRDTNNIGSNDDMMEEKELMTRLKPETSFISFYGEKIEISVMETLKNCAMTYLSYGYIKKENV